jgi:hypothetical protein
LDYHEAHRHHHPIRAILLAGCIYEAPLVKEDTIPVKPELIGVWESVPKEGSKNNKPERFLILKFSETEYLIRNPLEGNGICYRAYQIELGGKSCVQLKAIGSDGGSADWKDDTPRPYMVASFEVNDDKLVMRWLNQKFVGDDLNTTEALQEAFLKHKDEEELFSDQKEYRKVENSN